MSYTNYINKLSSETKKALEESSIVNQEIQDLKKYKFSMKHLNDNSIGYTIKYKLKIDEELKNVLNINSYEILLTYFIENEIFINHFHIVYNIYIWKKDIYISFYHTNRDYLQLVHPKIIENILQTNKEISKNIRNKFLNNLILPFSYYIKLLKKEYPVLIQIICNIIETKKLLNNKEEIINSIIKILQIYKFHISEYSSIFISTYKSHEDPIDYLGSSNNSKLELESKLELKSDSESPGLKVCRNKNYRMLYLKHTRNNKVKHLL